LCLIQVLSSPHNQYYVPITCFIPNLNFSLFPLVVAWSCLAVAPNSRLTKLAPGWLETKATADHSGYKFIAYPWHILPHILSLQNNSWCPHILTGRYSLPQKASQISSPLFQQINIYHPMLRLFAQSLFT